MFAVWNALVASRVFRAGENTPRLGFFTSVGRRSYYRQVGCVFRQLEKKTMKRALKNIPNKTSVNETQHDGVPTNAKGDLTGVSGDLTDVCGKIDVNTVVTGRPNENRTIFRRRRECSKKNLVDVDQDGQHMRPCFLVGI